MSQPPPARVENVDIARIFNEVADLLEIQSANPFRVRAYRGAARTVETLPVSAASLVGKHDGLRDLAGIGDDLADKIATIVTTGELPMLKALRAKTPEGLVQMMRVPGLGPKRARLFHDTLHITTLRELERAARAGELRRVRGVKERLERQILQGLDEMHARGERTLLWQAEAYAHPLLEYMKESADVLEAVIAGSYRRRCETVGDLDLLVSSPHPSAVAERFVRYPRVARVLAKGATRSAILLERALRADLRVVPAASWGAALHYFTGSKAHNIAVRTLGLKRGLKINEYGVFRGAKRVAGRTEEEIYAAVGLPWIPPELREDRGELDLAARDALPTLIELEAIRGDLQMHTTATDGHHSILEMARAAQQRGYSYVGITDHTSAVRVAGGLTGAELRRQAREIDGVQQQTDLKILRGAEIDIHADGRLDLSDAALDALDVVVIAVHSQLRMREDAMTKRIVRAIRHPGVHILAHPTGRLIGRREPYAVDMTAVVAAAREHDVAIEINSQPDRLDLNDIHIAMARTAGVKLVIDTDAHRVEELDFMRFGVDQARRGGCQRADVINTWTRGRLERWLASKRR